MAIEIRELVIRAVVAPEGERGATPQKAAPSQSSSAPRDEIVAECVEQVLDVLRLKEER